MNLEEGAANPFANLVMLDVLAMNKRFHKLNLKLTSQGKKREGEIAVTTAQGYFARKTDPSSLQSAANADKK